jgi:hypothetical protein
MKKTHKETLKHKIMVLKWKYAEVEFSLLFYTGGESWFPTLRDGHRLMMLHKTALRKTFGPKSDELTEGRTRLKIQELHNLTPQ